MVILMVKTKCDEILINLLCSILHTYTYFCYDNFLFLFDLRKVELLILLK